MDGRPSSLWPPVETALADVIEGDETNRITFLVSSLDYSRIEDLATSLRDPPVSSTANREKYTFGTEYVVVEVVFEDGVVWIMRLRMREREGDLITDAHRIAKMDSEIATLRYLRKHTSVPVPNIISYSTSSTSLNPLGAGAPPFMLMTAIIGCKLHDVGIDLKNPRATHEGRHLEILQNFMTQLATIHLELSRVTFPTTGSLYNTADGDGFIIGPCSLTGQGPFSTAKDYFVSHAESYTEVAQSQSEDSDLEKNKRMFVASTWRDVILSLADPRDDLGPFPLHHPDIHDDNIIIDVDGNIIGILDWDAASTVPIEEFAIPSIQTTDFLPFPDEQNPHERTLHKLFSDALRTVEGSLISPLPPSGRSYTELHDSLPGYVAFFIAYWMWSMECDYDHVGRSMFAAVHPDADMDDAFEEWLESHGLTLDDESTTDAEE